MPLVQPQQTRNLVEGTYWLQWATLFIVLATIVLPSASVARAGLDKAEQSILQAAFRGEL